jgi:ADP-ribose pyrophosphatase
MPKIVHKNPLFEVEVINAKKGYKAYKVIEKDVVVILPFVDKRHILLEKQLRIPVGKKIYEVPAGHIEKGEDLKRAANRELEEETGYKARKLKLIASYYISPGVLTVTEHILIATDLVKGKISRDKDEEIEVQRISFEKAVQMVKSGKIKDAKSMLAILCYLQQK